MSTCHAALAVVGALTALIIASLALSFPIAWVLNIVRSRRARKATQQ